MTRQITNFKPHGERVLVLPDNINEKVTDSGLVIPEDYDSMKNTPIFGTVVEIGDDVKGIKKGDIVVYQSLYQLTVEIGGQPHIIIKMEHIIGSSSPTN